LGFEGRIKMVYLIMYIILALITTGLLYWRLYDDIDSEAVCVLGGIAFPLTIVFLFFCLPVYIVNKIKNNIKR
jgi:hypothetical protein